MGLGLRLALRRQVKSDMPVIMRGVVELAVTDLTQVQRPPVVQLLAVGMVAYLGSPAFVHAGWVLAAQSLLLCRALVFLSFGPLGNLYPCGVDSSQQALPTWASRG